MRILVVGGGGREHALVRQLLRSPRRVRVFCAPGNGGTARPVNGRSAENVPIAMRDLGGLLDFARREQIDLTVVGPEEPLCAGIVDRFAAAGLRVFGPTAAAARLEGDKAFAKKMMQHAGVPTAEARIFGPTRAEMQFRGQPSERGDRPGIRGVDLAREFILTREGPLVIKAAGLAAGKGVFVCEDPAAAVRAVERLMVERVFGEAGDTVVVEERLSGREASVMALIDGRTIYLLEPAQDYKRLGDGDSGPNTGGMGAVCAAGLLSDDVLEQVQRLVFVPIVDALLRDDTPYRGVLYAGLMLTHAGPKVLEFNCRFGDPEAQVILSRLRTDLVDVLEAVVDGRLDQVTLDWDARAAVCVVMASAGYPGAVQTGRPIHGLDQAEADPDVFVYHAGTRAADGGVCTSGGRVLGVTALGESVAAARDRAYAAVRRIAFDGATWRTDIGAAMEARE